MRFFVALFFLTAPSLGFSQTSSIIPFQTDYCTNYPEGTKKEPNKWKDCCLMHDMFFWAGGNKLARFAADLELKSCVEKTGANDHAKVMYYAVRLGSYSPIKYSSKKWNYAWPSRASYQALSDDDIAMISAQLYSDYMYIPLEIKNKFLSKLQSYLD